MDSLAQILFAIQELQEDSATPKNIKLKLSNAVTILGQNAEMSTKISKALGELEELASDHNIQSHIRTQIFNIVSLLESV